MVTLCSESSNIDLEGAKRRREKHSQMNAFKTAWPFSSGTPRRST